MTITIKSGVPQGSVLGPFRFLLYISDMSNSISPPNNITFFADAAKLFSEVKDVNDSVF